MTPASAKQKELQRLRGELEQIDTQLVRLIAGRVALARAIGAEKRAAGLPLLDPSREAAVVRRATTLAREAQLPEESVRAVFWPLVELCRRVQEEG